MNSIQLTFQDNYGIAPSSKSVLLISHKEESKLNAIHRTEEVLIDADGGSKYQDPLKENKLILHHPSHADLCNETECERNEKVPNIHEGSDSGNVREMEPVLSLYKDKRGPPPCTADTEHALLRSTNTSPLDNKNGEVGKARVATGIIVTPVATRNKPAAVILSIQPFISRLWNKNENLAWRMYIGDVSYGLGIQYDNSVVDTVFFKYLLGKTTRKEKDQVNYQ